MATRCGRREGMMGLHAARHLLMWVSHEHVPVQIVPWGSNDAMALVQRKMDVDILITGHTHEFKVCVPLRCCKHTPDGVYWHLAIGSKE